MTAIRISNRDARGYVESCTLFIGSHLYSEQPAPGVYVVYSYGPHFPMFAQINGQWYENSNDYRATTKRHKYHSRPRREEFVMIDTHELKLKIDQAVENAEATA